ncbi:MAG TPA: cell wall hydrolase [Allosphingosinicella sp.]|nr:cell wall hydrolase [Allosphingosinicella sp.]
MRSFLGAAFAAALFIGTAAPALAQESPAPPLSAESLGLDALTDPDPTVMQEEEQIAPAPERRSLADLVYEHASATTDDEETECLARAVYWESNGEPLAGQLSVAEVIINRARSGRFAGTLCGVVRQRGQFSFVRGGYIPAPPPGARGWRNAVAIARIAREDLADGAAPSALFFHARRVNPGWRLTRVATVGNHVFYR